MSGPSTSVAGPGDHVIDLADLVVLGDRVRRRLVQFAAMDHADADARLADIDVADLLVQQLFGERLLRVGLQLG